MNQPGSEGLGQKALVGLLGPDNLGQKAWVGWPGSVSRGPKACWDIRLGLEDLGWRAWAGRPRRKPGSEGLGRKAMGLREGGERLRPEGLGRTA